MRDTARNERDEAATGSNPDPRRTRPYPGLQWTVLALGIGMFLTGAVALAAGIALSWRVMESMR